jgi:hypothetical protein
MTLKIGVKNLEESNPSKVVFVFALPIPSATPRYQDTSWFSVGMKAGKWAEHSS